jgi:hypothetical protein
MIYQRCNSTFGDPLNWSFYDFGEYMMGSYIPNTRFFLEPSVQVFAGDVNKSCTVDMYDLAKFSSAWLSSQSGAFYDQNCDLAVSGTVDFADLNIIADNWLGSYFD